MKEQTGVFQQTISVIGIIISFTVALAPLFINSPVHSYFLNRNVIVPMSFLIFIVGFTVVWYFTQISTNPTLKLFEKINKDYKYFEGYKINVTVNGFIKLAILFAVVFGIGFIAIYNFGSADNKLLSFSQGICYLLMFLSLISVFSLLYAQTKNQRVFQDLMESFPLSVSETLNKYKIINSGIEISQNEILSENDLRKLNLDPSQYMGSKKITVKTLKQQEKTHILVVDYSGSQIFRILKSF